MTTSSVQTDYLTTLSDTIDLSTASIMNSTISTSDTITLTGAVGSSSTFTFTNTGSSYTYSTASASPCITNINVSGISSIWNQQEFVDCMPNLQRLEAMCEEYPGLKIAFEKFKTTYFLVKDDYDTPKDQRPRP